MAPATMHEQYSASHPVSWTSDHELLLAPQSFALCSSVFLLASSSLNFPVNVGEVQIQSPPSHVNTILLLLPIWTTGNLPVITVLLLSEYEYFTEGW